MDRPWIEAGLKYAVAREPDTPSLLVQRVARLRATGEVTQAYLPLIIGSPEFTRYVLAVQTGTAVPHISAGQIASFEAALPPRDEQERIASILGTLADKVDSNRRLAALVDEIARALFRAHFVDFLGVQESEDSALGLIPKGWTAQPVAALAQYVNGKAFTKFGNGRGRMVIRIADLKSGPGGSTVWTDHEADDDFIARAADILFAWSGSLDVYRWYREEALINQHIFKVIPTDVPDWFVYLSLKQVMPYFQAIAADKATTMGHIKRSHLSEASVAVPPSDEMARWDEVFTPLFGLSLGAEIESQTLNRLRDELLPKLVSGQIRVPETADQDEMLEQIVEEQAVR
jgi:type I restriction enzyme S subunit